MITPINIVLLAVVLAALALAVLRRRRSGPARAAAARGAPTVSEEPAWAEAAATLAPVREREAGSEALDDLGDIITEPGWYLPGEVDVTWQGPVVDSGPLVPQADLVICGGENDDEPYRADEPWLEPAPAPADPESVTDPEPVESTPPPPPGETPRRSLWSRPWAVTAGVGAGLLAILLAAAVGWSVGRQKAESGSPVPAAAAGAPAAGTARGRSEAIASLREVDLAAARNDTGAARRLLDSIDPAVLRADPGLALQARIMLNRVRLTQSYLAATALAEAGRYGEARERMLALVPFRDAGARARAYGVEIAKGLVAEARTQAPVDRDRALTLLDQAQDIAPSLSAIREVRAEATG